MGKLAVKKPKVVTDNKEGFELNGVPWSKPGSGFVGHIFSQHSDLPSEELVPGLRDAVKAYQEAMFDLSKRLLRLMAVVLNLQEDFFEPHVENPIATLRLLHYWPLENFVQEIGTGAHTDYGLLTILKQDAVGGLQTLNAKDMQWVHATPIDDAFVVNIGDMLARWTAHRFKSTVHRVVNISIKERYSVPFFLEPNLHTIIRPGELCSGPKRDPTSQTCEQILESFYTAAGLITEESRDYYNNLSIS